MASQSSRDQRVLSGETPVSASGNIETLVQRHPELEEYDEEKEFLRAATQGDIETLSCLIDKGLDLETEAVEDAELDTLDGSTVLWLAIRQMQVEAVELLLKNGALVTHRVRTLPPLVYAICAPQKDIEMVTLLLDHGACPQTISGKNRLNALQWAVIEGKPNVVELLLSKGMSTERKDTQGLTALNMAASKGDIKIAEILLQGGADIDTRTEDGKATLIMSGQKNHVDAVKFWLEKGMDINATDNDGKGSDIEATYLPPLIPGFSYLPSQAKIGLDALWHACRSGAAETVRLLLEKGANSNTHTPAKVSGAMVASHNGNSEVLRALIDHGCNLSFRCDDKTDALWLAMNEKELDATRVLLESIGGPDYPKDSISLQLALSEGDVMTQSLISAAKLMYSYAGLQSDASKPFDWLHWVLDCGGSLVKPLAMLKLFQVALHDQDVEMIRALAEESFNFNEVYQSGYTPLSIAVVLRNIPLIQTLLDVGHDVNQVALNNRTPLECAIHTMKDGQDTEVFDILLKTGRCKINWGKGVGDTPFSLLLTKIDKWKEARDLAIRMLDSIQDVNDENNKDMSGYTLLHAAVVLGKEEFVDILLKRGANIEANDNHSLMTPLLCACSQKPSMVPGLLEKGVDITARMRYGMSALHVAPKGNIKLTQFLIDQGLNVDVLTERNDPPLFAVLSVGHEEHALCLMANGADIHRKAEDGDTALHLAVIKKLERAVEELLEKGADVNARNNQGWTPFHEACFGSSLPIVKMLIAKGADMEAQTSASNRPLHVAFIGRQSAIADYLLERGVDITARGAFGQTSLHLAAKYDHKRAVRFLLERGLETEDVAETDETALYCANGEATAYLLEAYTNIEFQNKQSWTPLHQAVSNADYIKAEALLSAGAQMDVRTTDDYLDVLERAEYLEDDTQRTKIVDLLKEHILERRSKHGNKFEPLFPQGPVPFNPQTPENEIKALAEKLRTDSIEVFVPIKRTGG